jgi:hypothetical protein
MDYQATDLAIKAAQLIFTAINFIGVIALWFASRGRATTEAINRVEAIAKEQHAGQEIRLAKLETQMQHMLVKDDLAPLYNLIRETDKNVAEVSKCVAGIEGSLESLEKGQERITTLIMQRGIEK